MTLSELLSASNFENQNFENHADEVAAAQAIAQLPAAAQQVIVNAVKNKSGMINHIGGTVHSSGWDALVVASVGDLNVTITRESVNIDSPLPFVLFASNDFQAGYVTTLNPLVAKLGIVGLSFAVTTDNATGDILITYTAPGPESDVVRIHLEGNINMRTFLAGMNNNYFKTKNFLVSISNEAYNAQQYAQTLYFGQLSTLGLTGANQLIFRSRTNSWMFRKDRVEVLVPEQAIVPEYSFAMNIIAVAGFEVGFDLFMSERANLNTLKK